MLATRQNEVPRNGDGDRRGPRFSIGIDPRFSFDWKAAQYGVVIWDNHNGFALGQAYAVVPDDKAAQELVIVLNAAEAIRTGMYI